MRSGGLAGRSVRVLFCGALAMLTAAPVLAQAPAPAPAAAQPAQPPPPPPKVEGSGEFAFVNTAGNAESTSIGVRGEVLMRPDIWLLAKPIRVQAWARKVAARTNKHVLHPQLP